MFSLRANHSIPPPGQPFLCLRARDDTPRPQTKGTVHLQPLFVYCTFTNHSLPFHFFDCRLSVSHTLDLECDCPELH